MDRLLSFPNRPHLLLRCGKNFVSEGDSSNWKTTFTMEVYAVTGQLFSSCYEIFGDTHSVRGCFFSGWECSFVDDDHIAVAYPDTQFGPEKLNVFLYDISRRQFGTCCLSLDDVISAANESIHDRTAEFNATAIDAHYLNKNRLIFILQPNSRGYRAFISYRLQWPHETSATHLGELKIESCILVRPPADFETPIFRLPSFICEGVADKNDQYLCVFDSGVNGACARYDRFFRVDLNGENVSLREPTWTYCEGDFWEPFASTYLCNYNGRVYVRHGLNNVWILESNGENFTWTERRLHEPLKPKGLLPHMPSPFAVNEQGGMYDLDRPGKPRFCGYVMVNREPPSLKLLAATRFFDSLGEKVGEEILCRSKEEIREKGYPQWVANLALK